MSRPHHCRLLPSLVLMAALAGCGGPGTASSLTPLSAAALPESHPPTATIPAPISPHSIITFPERDFLSIDGYPLSTPVTIGVFRRSKDASAAWVRIGAAVGTTDAATGLFEVNHPGGACWLPNTATDPEFLGTPDILPGDVVVVSWSEPDATGAPVAKSEQTTVADVSCQLPFAQYHLDGTADVIIKGRAVPPAGVSDADFPALIEERLVNPDRFSDGKRTLRASSAPAKPLEGTLTWNAATREWTATYTNLSAADTQKALASESRIQWLGLDPAGTDLTIFENPGTPGPFQFNCAQFALNAATGFGPAATPTAIAPFLPVNIANSATGVELSLHGITEQDTTKVEVLFPAAFATAPTGSVKITPPCGPSTVWDWTTATKTSDAIVQSLKDGLYAIDTRFTVTGGRVLGGAPVRLLVDRLAPEIVLSPLLNAAPLTQKRLLTCPNDPDAAISYQLDATGWKAYTGPVDMSAATTLSLKAVDAAGNVYAPAPIQLKGTPAPAVTATFSPAVGTTIGPKTLINLAIPAGSGRVFFTTDGSTPTTASTLFTAPFGPPPTVSSFTLKYISVSTTGTASAVTSLGFTVDRTPPTVTASPTSPGVFQFPANAPGTITFTTEATATLHVTTDGNDPVPSATDAKGTTSVTLPRGARPTLFTVKWFATDAVGNDSPIVTGRYRI